MKKLGFLAGAMLVATPLIAAPGPKYALLPSVFNNGGCATASLIGNATTFEGLDAGETAVDATASAVGEYGGDFTLQNTTSTPITGTVGVAEDDTTATGVPLTTANVGNYTRHHQAFTVAPHQTVQLHEGTNFTLPAGHMFDVGIFFTNNSAGTLTVLGCGPVQGDQFNN